MWREMIDLLDTWQAKVILASFLIGGTLGWVYHKRSVRKRTEPDPGFKYVQIEILSKESMLRLFQLVRERYSKVYSSIKSTYRKKRRKFNPQSEQYKETIMDFQRRAQHLLKEKSNEAFAELHINETAVDDSFAYYVTDKEIEEAKALMNEAINFAKKPEELTLDITREILEYYHDHLVVQDEDSLDEYVVATAQVEDEIYHKFGFEIDEIEKAHEEYKEELEDLTVQMRSTTHVVLQQTMDDSFEEGEIPEAE